MNEAGMMTFLDAITETAKEARERRELVFLYESISIDRQWHISSAFHRDWLFRAYPGGRKELSMRGKEMLLPQCE